MKLALLSAFLTLPLLVMGQTAVQPANPFPDQFIGAGVGYSQQASPQSIFGGVVYGKLLSAAAGTYSFTSITDTSVSLHPKFSILTQTETGACAFTLKFSGWDVFTCAQVGISLAGGTAGPGAAGTVVAMRPIGTKGWRIALAGGPNYAGAQGIGVSYPIGIIGIWGK